MTLQQRRTSPGAERPAPEASTRFAVSGMVKTDRDVFPLAP
jgi:hypothetical protein